MSHYEQVRSSSPLDEHHDSDDLELQEQVKGKVDDLITEQKERLLLEDGKETQEADDDDDDDHTRKRRRRRWWHLGLYSLMGIGILTVIAILLHHLYLHEPEVAVADTFRRQSSDYIIDPDWDYDAPPTRREYRWVITDITANPDGVFRPMLAINGQFPGPMIVCNEGDTIVVDVINEAKNATALHWHGLFQNGTNWNDGTVGVTQCPIAPGRSYRYEYTVKGQAGTCESPTVMLDASCGTSF